MRLNALQRSTAPSDDSPATPAGAPAHAIELERLTKVYAGTRRMPPKRALEGVDL